MPSEAAVEQWNAILDRVRAVVPEQSFCTWFANADLLSLDRSRLEIGAANRFIKSWLERNYGSILQDAAEEATGSRPSLVVTISPDRFRAMRDAQREEGVHEQVPRRDAPETGSSSKPALPQKPPSSPSTRLKDDYRFETFVPGPCNQIAYAGACRAVEAPGEYTPLLLHGGSGLGKTHLAQAVAHALAEAEAPLRVRYLHAEAFLNDYVQSVASRTLEAFRRRMRSGDVWIVDDVHLLGKGNKPATQEEFLLTFDDYAHRGAQIILTADTGPAEMAGIHERLRGRFAAGLVAALTPPDRPTRATIATRKARARDLDLAGGVLDLLAERTRGNVRELEGAVGRLAAMRRLMGMEITPATAEAALGLSRECDARSDLSIPRIVETAAEVFGLSPAEIRGRRRQARIRRARQAAILLCRRLTHASLAEIGSHFDGRNHATILSTLRKMPAPGEAGCPEAEVDRILRRLGVDSSGASVFAGQGRFFDRAAGGAD